MRKFISCVVVLLGLLPSFIWAQAKPVFHTFTFEDGAVVSGLADNGLWATAKGKNSNDESLDNYPYLLNLTTDKSIALLTEDEILSVMGCGVYDVTDDGKLAVGNYEYKPAVCRILADGSFRWLNLPVPAGYENSKGTVSSVTPDGVYMVGKLFSRSNDYEEIPVLWKDGEIVETPNLPTHDVVGTAVKQNRFLNISADGNIILGCLSYSYPGQGCSYYAYNRTTQTYDMIGTDVVSTPGHIDQGILSNNGEWVTGEAHVVIPIAGSDFPDEFSVSYKYNVKTKEFTLLYTEDDDRDISGFAISNDGQLFGASPIGSPARSLTYRVGGYWYDLSLVLEDRYGIKYTAYTGFDYTGTPMAVSSDGRTLAALAMGSMYSYVLTFPESYEDAAKGVNLLAKYTISPVAGASFSKFRSIAVTFDEVPVVANGATAQLYEDGVLVQTTPNIVANSSNPKSFTIGFRTYTMKKGSTYTVKIPAGTFKLEGLETASKEFEVSYIGREDKPVYVQAVNLEDGAEVASLSASSPVAMQFDTRLLLVDEASSGAALYQDGISEPLSDITLTVNSNVLYAYPLIKRNLFKDVNYTLKIPAGVVTDIMGSCASEEIVYHYKGVYVPELPADTLLFVDDFSDPSASYSNFIRYEGDHNVPVAEMDSLGFDADNTPWYFGLRESLNTEDYCAGSTSMYKPAGKSDDWMVINQLYLPNEYCTLVWDAQSYLKDKHDVLKVYVWAEDAVLSALNDSIVNEMKKNAVLVYEGQETYGGSEENLDGEWTNHRVPLNDFAGKYVYIAFVNQNQDQSMILVDNIEVVYKNSCLLGLISETTVVQQSEMEITGMVKVTDEAETYDKITVFFENADKTVSDTIVTTGLELKNGSVYNFTFGKKLPLVVGKENKFTMGVILGKDIKTNDFVVKDLAFAPEKKVVIEEATGAWCGNCPLGQLALEYISKSFPGQIIPISIHNDDAYDFASYHKALGMTSFPTGVVNRNGIVCSPITENALTGYYQYTSEGGNETFMDYVIAEMSKEAEAEVAIQASYDKNLNSIVVPTIIKYAVDKTSPSLNLLYIVLEDSLIGNQNNYFYKNDDPLLGDWGMGGIYGTPYAKIVYNDVARALIGTNINGSSIAVSSVKAGEEMDYSITFDIPSKISNINNTRIVVMLIDATSGKVINADVCGLVDNNSNNVDVAETGSNILMEAGDGQVIVKFAESCDASVALYSLDGTLINRVETNVIAGGDVQVSTKGYTGLVITKVIAGEHTIAKKVMMK